MPSSLTVCSTPDQDLFARPRQLLLWFRLAVLSTMFDRIAVRECGRLRHDQAVVLCSAVLIMQ